MNEIQPAPNVGLGEAGPGLSPVAIGMLAVPAVVLGGVGALLYKKHRLFGALIGVGVGVIGSVLVVRYESMHPKG